MKTAKGLQQPAQHLVNAFLGGARSGKQLQRQPAGLRGLAFQAAEVRAIRRVLSSVAGTVSGARSGARAS